MRSGTESALVLEVRAGNPAAVEALVSSYQDALYSYALHLLGDVAEAQEVTQDALLRACRALAGYSEARCQSLALRPWLFRITRNLVTNRRRATRPRLEPLPEPDGWHAPRLRDTTWPGAAVVALEEWQRLAAALATLSRTAREVVVLRFVIELSYAEIGAAMGISEAAARGQVFRALPRLRTLLMRQEAEDAM